MSAAEPETMYRLFLCIASFLTSFQLNAQPFALGSWREHLPYLHGKAVADGGNRIICATNEGLFAYMKEDESLKRFSKLNGLNDFGVSAMAHSDQYKVTVVAYRNANIDLLYSDDKIVNLSDIKRKNIPGNKTINRITVYGRYAYLACGFGIVVIDLDKKEIKDTYYIGNNGAAVSVNEITLDASWIYAAADDGIYRADVNSPSLGNFNNWSKLINSDSASIFTMTVLYNNLLFVNYRRPAGDTIMAYNGNWGVPLPLEISTSLDNRSFRTSNGNFHIINPWGFSTYDLSLTRIRYIDASVIAAPSFMDGITDNENITWIADSQKGMLRVEPSNANTRIYPSGPNSSLVSMIKSSNGKVWVSHGPRNKGYSNSYEYQGFSYFDGTTWTTWDGLIQQTPLFSTYNFFDPVALAIDPSNSDHVYIASAGAGLLDFNLDGTVRVYSDTSLNGTCNVNNLLPSSLRQPFACQVKVHSVVVDDEANVWASNAIVNTVMHVRKNDGNWKAFTFPGWINSSAKTGDIIIDDNGWKWMCIFENTGGKDGILVFNDNGTIDNTTDDKFEVVDFASNRVRSLAVDQDGTIWSGTETGLRLFYPPSLIPQKILIKQDNTYQYLLETEIITAIEVDGANRKWVGTENAGLFLFSPDGQQQIRHFTTDNSPLFSNNILALSIVGKTGELFIGTDQGLLSFQGDAVEGTKECKDLLVYPNPVKKEYNGPVAIKGVVSNGIVKITDINGNLVFQTRALGGQAIWNGTNFQGEKAHTGVYLVYASDEEGENTCITKVMLAH